MKRNNGLDTLVEPKEESIVLLIVRGKGPGAEVLLERVGGSGVWQFPAQPIGVHGYQPFLARRAREVLFEFLNQVFPSRGELRGEVISVSTPSGVGEAWLWFAVDLKDNALQGTSRHIQWMPLAHLSRGSEQRRSLPTSETFDPHLDALLKILNPVSMSVFNR